MYKNKIAEQFACLKKPVSEKTREENIEDWQHIGENN